MSYVPETGSAPRRALTSTRLAASHSGHHFDFAGLDRQGQTTLGADFQTECNGFLNVLESLFSGCSLADAPGDRWAFDHPHPIFVTVQSHLKTHRHLLLGLTTVTGAHSTSFGNEGRG